MSDNSRNLHKRIAHEEMSKEPLPATWSAKMPAYAGTSMEAQVARPYGGTKKKCLRCGRVYAITSDREHCACGGYLYTMNTYLQPETSGKGGEAIETGEDRRNC